MTRIILVLSSFTHSWFGYLLTKLGFSIRPPLSLEDFPGLLSYGKHNLRFSDFVGSVVLDKPSLWFRGRASSVFLCSHCCRQCPSVLRKQNLPLWEGKGDFCGFLVSDKAIPDTGRKKEFSKRCGTIGKIHEEGRHLSRKWLSNLSMDKRFKICFCMHNHRCFQRPDFETSFIYFTHMGCQKVDVELQDIENSINIHMHEYIYI